MVKYAPRTSTAAIKEARKYVGKKAYTNMCQAFVVTMFGTGAVGDWDGDRAADAQDGWKKAKAKGKVVLASAIKSYKDIPAGVALYWEGGSRGYGHTAISIGGGQMISTDAGARWGIVGIRDIGYISKVWGNGLVFRGYVLVEGNGHTLTDPPTKAKPAMRLRVGTFNLPDAEKIPTNPAARAKQAAALINAANLDVVGLQELVGPKGTKPSAWAAQVLKALGSGWRMVTPTKAYNENYIVYRASEVELVLHYDDVILPSAHGGRHLTLAALKDKSTGRPFVFGCTHLVHQKDAGKSREAQARVIAANLTRVSKLHGGCPTIVVGDMNRSAPLPVLGLQASQGGRLGATFTTYSKTTRSTSPDNELDHIYYSAAGAKLRGYNLLGVNGSKFTTTPRPSDHIPVIASIEFA